MFLKYIPLFPTKVIIFDLHLSKIGPNIEILDRLKFNELDIVKVLSHSIKAVIFGNSLTPVKNLSKSL